LLAGQVTLAVEPAAPTPGSPISEIRIAGNLRTRPGTLLREMYVHVGDPADPAAIERSRQAILDLELFKSVRADVLPGTEGAIVVFTVEEKRYLFALPVLGRSPDGDITYGVQGRIDNFRGRGHRLEAEIERTDLRSGAALDDERTLRIQHDLARFRNGPWNIDTDARYRRALLDTDREGAMGRYDSHAGRLAILASRWKQARGPSRGWRLGAGVSYENLRFDLIEGDPAPYFDTTEVGLLGRVLHRDVRNFELNRAGHELTVDLDAFTTALGCAADRIEGRARYRSYNPLGRRRYTNLDYQVRAAFASRSLFGDPVFDIGGGSRLRGYDRGEIEGDAYVLGNVEFLTPIGRHDALRGVLFLDVGDAFRGARDATLAHLEVAGGVGLRLKVRSFVRLELSVDVAHGFDGSHDGDTHVYASTGSTF
jgi:outer membrane protein assembly factor BamA